MPHFVILNIGIWVQSLCLLRGKSEIQQGIVTYMAETKLLYDRKSAALALSISVRSLDYLIARKAFTTRRIGRKVLIPLASMLQFAKGDHFGPVNGEEIVPIPA
jgi:hypothetical protein